MGTSSQQSVDIEQLTARIEEKLEVEMEETLNQRVHEKMALLMKKLVDKNPGL